MGSTDFLSPLYLRSLIKFYPNFIRFIIIVIKFLTIAIEFLYYVCFLPVLTIQIYVQHILYYIYMCILLIMCIV